MIGSKKRLPLLKVLSNENIQHDEKAADRLRTSLRQAQCNARAPAERGDVLSLSKQAGIRNEDKNRRGALAIAQQRLCGSGRVPPSPNCPGLRFGQLRIAANVMRN